MAWPDERESAALSENAFAALDSSCVCNSGFVAIIFSTLG